MISDRQIEAAARALCRCHSHAPEGTCAAICMDQLGDVPARGCAHAVDVHGNAVRAALEAAEAAAWSDDMEAAPKKERTWLLFRAADGKGGLIHARWVEGKGGAGSGWRGYGIPWKTSEFSAWRHLPAPPSAPSKDAAA